MIVCSYEIVVLESLQEFIEEIKVWIFTSLPESLFESFQADKKITLQFENETNVLIPVNCKVIESSPYKIILMVPKEETKETLEKIMRDYHVSDITVEEEDIGLVVEKIYKNLPPMPGAAEAPLRHDKENGI